MNTSIPNTSKPYFLDEFISSSEFIVKLFTNSIVGDENPIVFNEANFEGYNPVNLIPNKWSASNLENNYATCKYDSIITFDNDGEIPTEEIYGYYVTNSLNENVWYEKFSSPKRLDSGDGLGINIKVNLNKPGYGYNFVSIILKSSDPKITIDESVITVVSESWKGENLTESLIDITNRNFISNNSTFTLSLRQDIIPSADYPYAFNLLIQNNKFNNKTYSGVITKLGANYFEVVIDPIFPQPTTPPEPPLPPDFSVTLYGPFDTKAGITFSSATDESSFSFNYLPDANYSLPSNMTIYINDILLASVDYFSDYDTKLFTLQYESYVLNGIFTEKIYLSAPPPGPTLPPIN